MLIELNLPVEEFQTNNECSISPLEITEGVGVLVNNLLSAEECKEIIYHCDKIGWVSISREYPSTYRNNTRLLFKCGALSNLLWKRMGNLGLIPMFQGVRPFGFGNDGQWEIMGLNECFKACKYERGGNFKPHFDGVFVRSDDERSAVTIMLYLNEEFEGGNTNFLATDNKDLETYAHQTQSNENKKVMTALEPKTGLAVVFTHDILHEGAPVTSGQKYILRTELMFRRTSGKSGNYKLQPNYPEALRLYKMADILEAEGDPYGSTICYLKALDLQKVHKSTGPLPPPTLTHQKDSPDLTSLPQDILTLIFSHFSPSYLLSLAQVCKKWQKVTSEDWLWKRIIDQRWPLFRSHSSPPSRPPLPLLPPAKKMKPKKPKKGGKRGEEEEEEKEQQQQTWKECFIEQSLQKPPMIFLHTRTKSMAGFCNDFPRHFRISTCRPFSHYHYNVVGHSLRETNTKMFVFDRDSLVYPGAFELNKDWSQRNSTFTVKNDNVPYDLEYIARVWCSLLVEMVPVDQKKMDTLFDISGHLGLETYLHSISHPVLYVNYLCTPEKLAALCSVAFEVFRAPAFCVCSFGELVLHSLNISTGIVVDFGFVLEDREQQKFSEESSTTFGKPQVFVDYVKNGKREAVTTSDFDSVPDAIVKCFNSGDAEALKNIILVGTKPEEPEKLTKELSSKLQGSINVSIAPDSEMAIWKGASLFAFSTHSAPAYYADKLASKKSFETRKWMNETSYMRNAIPFYGQDRYLAAANITLPLPEKGKCIVA